MLPYQSTYLVGKYDCIIMFIAHALCFLSISVLFSVFVCLFLFLFRRSLFTFFLSLFLLYLYRIFQSLSHYSFLSFHLSLSLLSLSLSPLSFIWAAITLTDESKSNGTVATRQRMTRSEVGLLHNKTDWRTLNAGVSNVMTDQNTVVIFLATVWNNKITEQSVAVIRHEAL